MKNIFQNKIKSLKIALIVSVAAILLVSCGTAEQAGKEVVKNSDLVIQVSEITEEVKFFPVEIEGTELEVLAVRASDGTIRTAFNTCQICYSSGKGYYVQDGSELVCQNCGNRFGMDDVEVTRGGCNPVPITEDEKTVSDASITISKEYLTEAKAIFSRWKK